MERNFEPSIKLFHQIIKLLISYLYKIRKKLFIELYSQFIQYFTLEIMFSVLFLFLTFELTIKFVFNLFDSFIKLY